MGRWVVIAIALLAAGCGGIEESARREQARRAQEQGPASFTFAVPSGSGGPFPTGYKTAVAGFVQTYFRDPYSLRNVGITTPVEARFNDAGWLVCLTANARNAYGGYAGQSTYALLLRNGSIVEAYPRITAPPILTPLSALQRDIDQMSGVLALNLCGQAVSTGVAKFEPFPELEGRR